MEGTQGTSLSLHHGPYPYVTSRETTALATTRCVGCPIRGESRSVVAWVGLIPPASWSRLGAADETSSLHALKALASSRRPLPGAGYLYFEDEPGRRFAANLRARGSLSTRLSCQRYCTQRERRTMKVSACRRLSVSAAGSCSDDIGQDVSEPADGGRIMTDTPQLHVAGIVLGVLATMKDAFKFK
jgi:hypothetical protein